MQEKYAKKAGQQRESGDAPHIPLHRTEDRGTYLYLLRGIQGL